MWMYSLLVQIESIDLLMINKTYMYTPCQMNTDRNTNIMAIWWPIVRDQSKLKQWFVANKWLDAV